MALEPRAYGPELTAEEREEICARVSSPEPGVIAFHELAVMSSFTVDLMFDRMVKLYADQRVALALDLRGTKLPDAPARATLRRRIEAFVPHCRHAAVAVGSSLVMSAMVRVFLYSTGHRSVSTHVSFDDALEEAARRRLSR